MTAYKKINSLKLLIDDAQKALDAECYFAALCVLLTIPDICGNYLYPNLRVGERYKTWFDEYIGNSQKINNENEKDPLPYVNGSLIYKLRCDFLHTGQSSEVEKEYENSFVLNNFILRIENKKPLDIYGDESSSRDGNKEYILNIRHFGVMVLSAARQTLKRITKNKIEIKTVKVEYFDNELLELKKLSICTNVNFGIPNIYSINVNASDFKKISNGHNSILMPFNSKNANFKKKDIIRFTNDKSNKYIEANIISFDGFLNLKDVNNKCKKTKTIISNELTKMSDEEINLNQVLAIYFEIKQ